MKEYYLEYDNGFIDEDGCYSEEPVYMSESEASYIIDDYEKNGIVDEILMQLKNN